MGTSRVKSFKASGLMNGNRSSLRALVVDDFGVKYCGKEHAEHLMGVSREHYEVTEDWEGGKFIGITLDWDYDEREVHLSIPGYAVTSYIT